MNDAQIAQGRVFAIIIGVAVIYFIAQFGIGIYTDFLWFQHLDLQAVFLTQFLAAISVGFAVGIPFALIFFINTWLARRLSIGNVLFFSEEVLVAQKFVMWAIWGVTLLLGWAVGLAASINWLPILQFINQTPFGLNDPIFNMDVSFYLFSLPIFQLVQSWLVTAFIFALIGTAGIYALAQQNNLAEGRVIILPHVQLHLSILGALIFLVFAAGHWLSLFDLMYSPRGVAFGPSYTDLNVSIPALWTMAGAALFAALLLLLSAFIRRPMIGAVGIVIWGIVGLVGNGFLPGIIQRYVVEPNELVRETPYIENNIEFTNIAYGLNEIQEREFSELEPFTAADIEENAPLFQNIRLWDYRPLRQTYQQIQAIRLYYQFLELDLDRYNIDGEVRQVALAARELDVNQLESSTWVTERLQFTHGYGVVMNPISEVTGDGLPELWIQDLPPVSNVPIEITRPEIYYGEADNGYVFVGTNVPEFDYPSGSQNELTRYEGTGGVPMDTYLKRLIFALRLADSNMIFSQDFTNQSRVMFYRQIQQRARVVAPFLSYDTDPYLVIADDGRLYWIQDAYTTSGLFPYSEPAGRLQNISNVPSRMNYIRNSVKILIDAYNGDMTFYMIDTQDPLLQTYAVIFPTLFTPDSQMPTWMREHLRYPEGLFRVQSELYRTYHMRDVNVFYNKEDLWQVPQEVFDTGAGQGGNTQPVEPYYVIMRLPGEEENEFALIQPFTPNNKDNLISWLAARSDGEFYGDLIVYKFPKQGLIFGPLQIEGRIDQNPEISSQITLWDQGGSQVIRGNLLVLPIGNTLLYVEPLYLQAENGQIPELKRVILATEDSVVMEETLEESLASLLEAEGLPELTSPEIEVSTDIEVVEETAEASTETESVPSVELGSDLAELASEANSRYQAAQDALSEGDWTTYGEELEQMEAILARLVELTNGQ